MEEQYITFEVAKLAKEKGFDIRQAAYYDEHANLSEVYSCYCNDRDVNECSCGAWESYDEGEKAIQATTQALLQKWLREVHQIYVDVDIDQTTAPKFCYMIIRFIGNPTDLAAEEWDWQNYPNGVDWGLHRTWEDALEEGLFEALKLI